MVKALTFKGDKKPSQKRKRLDNESGINDETPESKHLSLTRSSHDEEAADDQAWVSAEALSDISGPILLVLPTSKPTTLSCDQLGKVFAQKVENLVEGLPDSAEPHDVRQVWVATRVVGSEDNFTFKGHHGRYLGCDKYGLCFATREAISPEETFKLGPVEGRSGIFSIKTGRETYLSVSGEKEEVRGDGEEAGENTYVRVRMQARFKPKHRIEKAEKVRAKISRRELEEAVGRRLEDDEVKMLKKARREGNYHEALLDLKTKGKHDKFA